MLKSAHLMQPRTFVTGFGPFLRNATNPSGRLAEQSGHPHRILEVSYDVVTEFLDTLDPSSFDRLLMIGLKAKGRKLLTEHVGRNVIGRVPDVRGHVPEATQIRHDGPRMLSSTLWTGEERQRHPMIGASRDAGSYLCNFILYEALVRFPDKRVGFLHVPPFARVAETVQMDVLRLLLQT